MRKVNKDDVPFIMFEFFLAVVSIMALCLFIRISMWAWGFIIPAVMGIYCGINIWRDS